MTTNPPPPLWTALKLWGLTLLTLHLAAPALPEASTWSVWPYSLLPPPLAWGLALSVALLIIPGLNDALRRPLARLSHWMWHSPWQQSLFIALSLMAGGLFYLARLQHLRWGDAYLLTIVLSHPDPATRVIYNWQAPLTVLLHQRLWQFVAQPLLGWPVAAVYAMVSILCGMLFVFAALNLCRRLSRTPMQFFTLSGLLLTTGSMQLFFGYVENYTLIALALLLTIWLSWRALDGTGRLFWPLLAFSLTNALHPSTVFLWPSMLLLSGLCVRRGHISRIDALLQTLLTPLLIGGAIFSIMEMGGHGLTALTGVDQPGGGDAIWFVPLTEAGILNPNLQHYTLFAPAHFVDWGNIHLLISPFGLPLLIMLMVGLRSPLATPTERDFARFLSLMSLLYLLLTFLWNPDYGGRRDWDLFAPSAFVYTLLAGLLLSRVLPRPWLGRASMFVVAVSLLHTAAWVYANTLYWPPP